MPLMTYEEYNGLKHSTPHTFIIKSGDNLLYYFGERHSFDPGHGQWANEKEFWHSFVTETENHKRIVFVEGGKRPTDKSEEEAILNNGGMGFITYLAHQEGIDTYCPEPPRTYERQELLKQFSKEESQYYYFARVVGQWNRKQEPRPGFEEYTNAFLEKDRITTGWEDFDFSLGNMEKIHHQLFGTEFNKSDLQFFDMICNPSRKDTVINKVATVASEIRDTRIVKEIEKYVKDGYSIYVQFGATHAVIQEPLLKEVIQ